MELAENNNNEKAAPAVTKNEAGFLVVVFDAAAFAALEYYLKEESEPLATDEPRAAAWSRKPFRATVRAFLHELIVRLRR